MDDEENPRPGPANRLKRFIPRNNRPNENWRRPRNDGEPARVRVPRLLPLLNAEDARPNRRDENYDRARGRPQRNNQRHNINTDAQQGGENANNNMNRHGNSNRRGRGDFRGQNRYGHMGFLTLEKIANTDTRDILLKLNEYKQGFMEILNSNIYSLDFYPLIFEVLAKVALSPFEEMKSKLFLDVCNSLFITSLRNYLTDLPYPQDKHKNKLYWDKQNEFWENFITFCEDIFKISPATTVRTCRALIEIISKTCLEYLNQRHEFALSEEATVRLEELRNKLINYADGNKRETKDTNAGAMLVGNEDMAPPDNFRELSVIPSREDLLDCQPFLRPNIINGAYSDVEHYLDVQFRLLREDCFGPIRVGIGQFLADPTKRRYDNVRVYRNVRFAGPYISNYKVGTQIEIDLDSSKYFKKINWAHSKRLLFGSLVLFTKDNFSEFVVATILDRDNMRLASGKLAISIIETTYGVNIRDDDTYTMIESEVYFEPYYHVLKALQADTFPKHLAMQEYIVKVNPATDKPCYLTDDTQYAVYNDENDPEDFPGDLIDQEEHLRLFKEYSKIKYNVLKTESWPTKEQLKFNESQYEAFKLALTREFAVIQGPPGTGKTYVALSVAKTLLQNVESKNGCLMLIICYTNHALDQFLEGISNVTKRIVRIGSQSRNKAMEAFNLTNLRKKYGVRTSRINNYFIETKTKLKQSIDGFQESLLLLDILNNGVVNYKEFSDEVVQFQLLNNYYEREHPSVENPLMHWLFANSADYVGDFNECVTYYGNLIIDNKDNEFNNRRNENNIALDDDKERTSHLEIVKKRLASFLLIDSQLQLKNIVSYYRQDNLNFKDRVHAEMMIQELNSRINLYNDMVRHRAREIHLNITDKTDFFKINPQIRWRLYFMWVRGIARAEKKKIAEFQEMVSPVVTAYEETRMVMDMEILHNTKTQVLGMTTSGAARMRKLLQAISPKIVIVEEAAEVLEQHIITSLTENCQHLVLIGDHQQLRPSASYLKLAKQYNIEVSLFERMITNGIHSRRLNVQHRMRPEIAALISPHIYPELENHPTVENFGNVPGLEKNVFFFSHKYPEEVNASEGNSRANHKEADLTLALANYLIQQGYSGEEVTILAAYSGQMFYMRKERQKYARLADVKITVVDNYQGEESKIILLSFVRNNPENNIGFLGTENRICVALSRAKQGFYMFGNMEMLKLKSDLWKKIAATLENNGSLGTVLNLKCQVHPEQITQVLTADDFVNVPEGGCLRKCNYQYSCGHHCFLYCHGYDREHKEIKCTVNCESVLCDIGHVCPLKCYEDCQPCKVLLKKTLPCGHEMDVYCHREPDDPENKCPTKVEVVLPSCGHKVMKSCYMDIEKVRCTEKCKQRLEKCGHACERTCHVSHPDHSDYICLKDCVRRKKGCVAELDEDLGPHQCNKRCNEQCDNCNVQVTKKRSNCKHAAKVACCEDIDATPCKKMCARTMECGHHCKKKCSEPCGDCKIMVTKEVPDCKHKIKVQCMAKVRREDCTEKCIRTLSCGHPCTDVCSAKCDETKCKELINVAVPSPCGHNVKLPCNAHSSFVKGQLKANELLKYCKSPCGAELACKHICGGSCAQCYQGRIHAPCKQTCHQTNICGHQCQEPCNQICPPCHMFCEVQCKHSKCGQRCGEPCVTCKEKCSRRCNHGACTRLCSDPCSRAPCNEPCPRTLKCGDGKHRCRGLCGEPCPDICKECRPDDFPTDFLGDQYEDDDKFILLQDCGHVLEIENMDNLMLGDQENIKIRQCPFCRKPIINTNRYKDLVNKMFKEDINPIKERVYGKNTEINKKLDDLRRRLGILVNKCFKVHAGLEATVKQLIAFMRKPQQKMYLLQVEMLLVYCEVIEMITECWTTFHKSKTPYLKEELEEHIIMILKVLKIDLRSRVPIKISEQQQKDIGNELKRLNSICQLAVLLQVDQEIKNNAKVKAQIDAARRSVFTLSVFNEDEAVESLKVLQTSIKSTSNVVSKMQREMIVKAIGLKAGHWYKCPNGHYYCIDQCGGAMEESICPDCGAMIGGTSHRLLEDNAHAPEMDGSKFAAYSEEANNMANFQLD